MATTAEILALKITVKGGKEAAAQLKKIASETKKTGTETEKANKKSESSFKSLKSAILPVTLAIGGLVAATVIIDKFAQRAEKIRLLSNAFETLTKRVGQSSAAFLEGMRRASDGFVSDMELMQQANNALILGLPVTSQSMEELTDIAIRLGSAMGRDATESINSMVVGIGRQSRQLLDNLGIIISVDEAVRKYAAANNMSVESMTQAERNLAFYNETLEQGRLKVEGLGDAVRTMGSTWIQATVKMKNFFDEFLTAINELPSLLSGDSFMGISRSALEDAKGVAFDVLKANFLRTAIVDRGMSNEEAVRAFLDMAEKAIATHEKNVKAAGDIADEWQRIKDLVAATVKLNEDLAVAQFGAALGAGPLDQGGGAPLPLNAEGGGDDFNFLARAAKELEAIEALNIERIALEESFQLQLLEHSRKS